MSSQQIASLSRSISAELEKVRAQERVPCGVCAGESSGRARDGFIAPTDLDLARVVASAIAEDATEERLQALAVSLTEVGRRMADGPTAKLPAGLDEDLDAHVNRVTWMYVSHFYRTLGNAVAELLTEPDEDPRLEGRRDGAGRRECGGAQIDGDVLRQVRESVDLCARLSEAG